MTRTTILDTAKVVSSREAAQRHLGREDLAYPAPLLPASTGSTNDDLAATDAADLTLVATLEQNSGKGRLDRDWVAPPGACLTFSVNFMVPSNVGQDALGWVTVLAAMACAHEVNALAQRNAAAVKWPNDLILDGKKVAGILARFVPGAAGTSHRVVVGIGLNLDQSRDELPVGTATSLALQGIGVEPEAILGRIWARLGVYVSEFFAADGDVTTALSGLAQVNGATAAGPLSVLTAARTTSSTLGSDVRVHLPGGQELTGTAIDLGLDGCLVVRDPRGESHHVHAGDVVHLRRSDGGYV